MSTVPGRSCVHNTITFKNKDQKVAHLKTPILGDLKESDPFPDSWAPTSWPWATETGSETWWATPTTPARRSRKTWPKIMWSTKPGIVKRSPHFKSGSHIEARSESTAMSRWPPAEFPTGWPIEVRAHYRRSVKFGWAWWRGSVHFRMWRFVNFRMHR